MMQPEGLLFVGYIICSSLFWLWDGKALMLWKVVYSYSKPQHSVYNIKKDSEFERNMAKSEYAPLSRLEMLNFSS